jgi:hypothetical protein
MARFLYLLSCGALVGGQLFFAAVAAQVVFPREVAALPRDDPRRQLAADLVGAMSAPSFSAGGGRRWPPCSRASAR